MPLTDLQHDVCRLLAAHRRRSGESYVAGGVAINELLGGKRLSRDIDIFHDTAQAVRTSWDADRVLLGENGFEVEPVRELPSFIEAIVSRAGARVVLQWAQDSAFRYFPLVEHSVLGLALHPLDLATNKVLALVGRHEPRDWIDVIQCDSAVQPLGYLAWAAAGKDPGFGPLAIIEEAARSARYTQMELGALEFEGAIPEAATLSRRWHAMVAQARELIDRLPGEHAGMCVVTMSGELARDDASSVGASLAQGRLRFHHGTIRGAWPQRV
jgi:hypothetical protein